MDSNCRDRPWQAGATNMATHLPYLATNLPPYFLVICFVYPPSFGIRIQLQ
jgi:hypothetical protein